MSGPLHQLAAGQLAVWTAGWLALATTVVQVFQHATAPSSEARVCRWMAVAAGLTAAAVRLAVGAAPGDWAEAGRWSWLYASVPGLQTSTAAVPILFEPLLAAGLPANALYAGFGPVVSGLGAASVVALAVRAGARPLAAVAAGFALALWPPHVVLGSGGALTAWGGLCWTLLLLTLTDTRLAPSLRSWGSAGWAVVLLHSRPEYLIAPGVALVGAWMLRWPWRAWWQLALVLLVLGPWSGRMGVTPGGEAALATPAESLPLWTPLAWQFADAAAAPVWVCVAGLVGLWWVRPRGLGALLAGLWCALTAAYALHKDGNLVLGSWRYLLSLLPILLTGAAVVLSQLRPMQQRLGSAVMVLSCLPYASLWWQPTDLRAEYALLQTSAPGILRHAAVLVIDDDNGDSELGYEHRDRAAMALALASGRRWKATGQLPTTGGTALVPLGSLGNVAVYGLSAWLRMTERPAGPTAIWMGIATNQSERAAIAQATDRALLLHTVVEVWPTLDHRGWCKAERIHSGLQAPSCALELGWAVAGWPKAPAAAAR